MGERKGTERVPTFPNFGFPFLCVPRFWVPVPFRSGNGTGGTRSVPLRSVPRLSLMLKVTAGFDQMHIEDDVEGIEEECIIFEKVPDVQIISEERAEKTKVQSKITSFFIEK